MSATVIPFVMEVIDAWDDRTVAYLRATIRNVPGDGVGQWGNMSINVTITSAEWKERLKDAFVEGLLG